VLKAASQVESRAAHYLALSNQVLSDMTTRSKAITLAQTTVRAHNMYNNSDDTVLVHTVYISHSANGLRFVAGRRQTASKPHPRRRSHSSESTPVNHSSPALPRCTIVTSFPKFASLSLTLDTPDLLVADVTDLPERDSFHLPRVVPALATLTDEDGIALLIDPEEGVTERTRAGAYASGGASWGMYMAEEG
jgi:hypothetical protein